MKDLGFDKLGFYSLSVLYVMSTIGSFLNAPLVTRLGPKYSMFWGALCYFFWIICSLFPATSTYDNGRGLFIFKSGFIYTIMIFSAGVNGLGASILWVGQGNYIAQCASEENKGRFFSLFWFIFMWQQIVGNLLGAFVLGSFSKVVFFIIMSILSFVGSMTFLFLRTPIKPYSLVHDPNSEEPEAEAKQEPEE